MGALTWPYGISIHLEKRRDVIISPVEQERYPYESDGAPVSSISQDSLVSSLISRSSSASMASCSTSGLSSVGGGLMFGTVSSQVKSVCIILHKVC